MDLDNVQKPNIGQPEFAKGKASGRSTSERKMWAIVTTIAFALFWFSGLFVAASLFGQMFYREAGDFKTSYVEDNQTFPIKFDRYRYYAF
jgi:hypothetical protein